MKTLPGPVSKAKYPQSKSLLLNLPVAGRTDAFPNSCENLEEICTWDAYLSLLYFGLFGSWMRGTEGHTQRIQITELLDVQPPTLQLEIRS